MERGLEIEPTYVTELEGHVEALRLALGKTVGALEEFIYDPDKHSIVMQARAVLDKRVG